MKYYFLKNVSDYEIKGVKTGLSQVELDKNNPVTAKLVDFFSGLHYWENGKTVPDFGVENCTASLYKGAILTDFLEFAPNLLTCRFMISDRLAELFTKFNIQPYYLYPVTYKLRKGSYSIRILSISEPAPDGEGAMGCNVRFIDSVVPNDMYSLVSNRSDKQQRMTVRFIKTKDGWRIGRRID